MMSKGGANPERIQRQQLLVSDLADDLQLAIHQPWSERVPDGVLAGGGRPDVGRFQISVKYRSALLFAAASNIAVTLDCHSPR